MIYYIPYSTIYYTQCPKAEALWTHPRGGRHRGAVPKESQDRHCTFISEVAQAKSRRQDHGAHMGVLQIPRTPRRQRRQDAGPADETHRWQWRPDISLHLRPDDAWLRSLHVVQHQCRLDGLLGAHREPYGLVVGAKYCIPEITEVAIRWKMPLNIH